VIDELGNGKEEGRESPAVVEEAEEDISGFR